jgi:hypothetical protein
MEINETKNRTWIIARKTRWLAIATGSFTAAAACLSITFLLAVVPTLLILGAIVQPRYPRTGLGMMVLSALSVSLWVIPIGALFLSQGFRTLRVYHDFNAIAITSLFLVAFFLVVCCDAALIVDFLKLTRLRGRS